MKYDWSGRLLSWYQKNKRDLPWRGVGDPYKVWLSEIILQQTRIDQGTAYYHRFTETFPTVIDLANADEQLVMRLWQGLGYYSRARSLHHTAKIVRDEYNGLFPTSYDILIKLKGIGPYTAAAISSIAGQEDQLAIDGNVFRVLSRSFNICDDISEAKSRKVFDEVGSALLPKGRAGDFNQALMDLGATVCTPRNPDCLFCPVAENCHARSHGTQHELPVKSNKIKHKIRYFNYLCFRENEQLFMKARSGKDIWSGLWDFPIIETTTDLDWWGLSTDYSDHKLLAPLIASVPIQSYMAPKHQLTHQTIVARFHVFDINHVQNANLVQLLHEDGFSALSMAEVDQKGKPVLLLTFLQALENWSDR